MTPKFSVIIPVYNGAMPTRHSVESVSTQARPAYEIIVVIEGPGDDTPPVQGFGAAVRCLHQENDGVSGSEAAHYSPAVRRGVKARLRHGRLDLGHALSRAGRRCAAIGAVTPTLWENPGPGGLRDIVSMVRG